MCVRVHVCVCERRQRRHKVFACFSCPILSFNLDQTDLNTLDVACIWGLETSYMCTYLHVENYPIINVRPSGPTNMASGEFRFKFSLVWLFFPHQWHAHVRSGLKRLLLSVSLSVNHPVKNVYSKGPFNAVEWLTSHVLTLHTITLSIRKVHESVHLILLNDSHHWKGNRGKVLTLSLPHSQKLLWTPTTS